MADNTSFPCPIRRRTTIAIPLPSIRKYVPGSGPPPPRVSLAPPRDTTGYIINQFVLPTDNDTTPTSRRLIYYHVGFTDFPAVKILLPCNEVLDYVSPRELEDWEYKNLESKEEERARRLAEKRRVVVAAKKPGQKPKVPMQDVGLPALSSADEAFLLAQEVAGPSLSTPQKRKQGDVLHEDAGDTSNIESDDDAIRRQLQGANELGSEDDLGADVDSVDQLALQDTTSTTDTPSRGGSAVPPMPVSIPAQTAATPIGPAFPSSAPVALSASQTDMPTAGRIHPAWAHVFGQQNRSEKLLTLHGQAGSGQAERNGTSGTVPAKPQARQPSSTHTSKSASWAGSASKSSLPRIPNPRQRESSAMASDSSMTKRKASSPNVHATEGKRHKPKKQKMAQEDEEPPANEWEVKDLLDDQWVTENGTKVHKYLVLWEGDWPPDQNPTWEPAENVQDPGLIKRYLKKKKAGLLKPCKKAQNSLHRYLATPQYSSVAEAFEGGIDEQTGPVGGDIESDTDPPNETFLVTEHTDDLSAIPAKISPSFKTFDDKLARYNQAFPRI
ncbi:uncharacterized protein B0T15DRAFT_13197 [Chaetomium strumarium]|uniref:Chromo domain-containing protein n=1 Tax=Chaetomium strumarium TaxID=1170767 RepID=A0AAJ0H1C3_9PEZI|nr:hypothetical protein B0T15DRAFT_13197 [Chaetomium strumarium]